MSENVCNVWILKYLKQYVRSFALNISKLTNLETNITEQLGYYSTDSADVS